MTILEPNRTKEKLHFKLIIGALLFSLVGISTFAVITYTQTVELKHHVFRLEENFSKLAAQNADLKNQVYEMLSPERLTVMAQGLGLEIEKHPKYLETTVETLATQF